MENLNEELTCLPALGIIADLSEETRKALFEKGQLAEMKAGDYLVVQGQHHQKLSMILSGKLKVKSHAHGDTVELAELGPGMTVGEMSAIDPRKASANVEATEDVTYWWISMENFHEFVATDWERGYLVLMVLAKELCSEKEFKEKHIMKYII